VVEVEDEGPGLADVDSMLVFERFFRSDPSRSRHTGGAGLGLAIVASIAKAHGGSVEVARGAAGGALFRVLIPAAPISQGACA
jgi:two-component system OmpR family sensor kinase